MKAQPTITDYLVLKALQKRNHLAANFHSYSRRYNQAVMALNQFVDDHDELQSPQASLPMAICVILIILSLGIFQANLDTAVIAEMIDSGISNSKPWFVYPLGIAFALFGFWMAKGMAYEYRNKPDALGRPRITAAWWWSLVGVLVYLGAHSYFSLMMYQTGGDTGHYAAFLPTLIALLDVILGLVLGHIAILVLRKTWLEREVGRLAKAMEKGATQTADADMYYKTILQNFNALRRNELTYQQSAAVQVAIAFHETPSVFLLPPSTITHKTDPVSDDISHPHAGV